MKHRPEDWDGWKLAWQHAYFLVWVLLATAGALSGGGASRAPVGVVLAALLAAWYAYWFVVRRVSGRIVLLGYLPVAALLWAGMVAVDGAFLPAVFGVLAPLCMPYPLWSAAAVAVYSGVWLWQEVSHGGWSWTTVIVWASATIIAVGLIGYVAVLDREGRERHRLLTRLQAAQDDLAASEREAGMLNERQRMARDIHDTLTQGFASIVMLLEAAQENRATGNGASGGGAGKGVAGGGGDAAGRQIDQALRTARENLAESRRLVWALRPIALDDGHLPGALKSLTRRLTDETGLRAETVITGLPAPVRPDIEAALVRIVQEALSNVRKHAHATEVTLTLSYMDDLVVVDIHDDGVGFTPAPSSAGGVGLAAMRERAAELAGTLTIESAPGDGTTIGVAVPTVARDPVRWS